MTARAFCDASAPIITLNTTHLSVSIVHHYIVDIVQCPNSPDTAVSNSRSVMPATTRSQASKARAANSNSAPAVNVPFDRSNSSRDRKSRKGARQRKPKEFVPLSLSLGLFCVAVMYSQLQRPVIRTRGQVKQAARRRAAVRRGSAHEPLVQKTLE